MCIKILFVSRQPKRCRLDGWILRDVDNKYTCLITVHSYLIDFWDAILE